MDEHSSVSEHVVKMSGYVQRLNALLMTHKYRGLQQSLRKVKPKFIDSTQGEPKNIYKP
jgi:hypothetical protein